MAESEHARLFALAEASQSRDSAAVDYLIEELTRAHIVPDSDLGPYVARMGSTVTYQEDKTGRVRKVTLVYPREANIEENKVSVLVPIGAALIGLSPAQRISWLTPDGQSESLTVLDVRNESIAVAGV